MKKNKKRRFINLFKNLNKTKPGFHFCFIISLVAFLTSVGLLSYSLILLSGIETLIRIVIIVLMIIYFLVYFVIGSALLISKKHGLFVFMMFLTFIFSVINGFGFYYIDKTYNIFDDISKEKITYTTSLLTLEKDIEIKTVGIISDDKNIEGNILPNEYIINKEKTWKIIKYDDNYKLINALLNKEVDAIFLTSNYLIKYSEEYPDLVNCIEVDSYSQTMANNDMVLSTNHDVTKPFTILLLGVDSQYDGLENNAAFNGDSIMLISFNPKTLSATVFSIPRDTYVPIACNNNKSYKINSAAAYGTKCMIDTIQNLTDIEIDYYAKINFKGVVGLVDALGGIDVDVDEPDFNTNSGYDCKGMVCEQNSNREFGNNIIYIKPGKQHLNGEQALAYSRNRHQWAMSDFVRVEHQQAVVSGIIQSAKSIRSISKFNDVLNSIIHNIDTNMSTKQILNLYNVAKDILIKSNLGNDDLINIQKTYLSGYDLSVYENGFNAYTFQYYEESLDEIVKAMKINLEKEEYEMDKSFSFSANKEYVVPVIGKTYTAVKKNETLPSFVDQNINYLESWASSRNITINKNYIDSNTCINDSILEQDVHSGTLVSKVTQVGVNICKNIIVDNPEPTTDEPILDNELDEIINIADDETINDNNEVTNIDD